MMNEANDLILLVKGYKYMYLGDFFYQVFFSSTTYTNTCCEIEILMVGQNIHFLCILANNTISPPKF